MSISGFHCKYFDIGGLQLATWACEYQPLNIHGELEKMKNWLDANPRRRKKNYQRFIVNWLNKNHALVAHQQVQARMYARVGSQRTSEGGLWVDGIRVV